MDDITKQPLDPRLCREVRKKELEYFASKGVFELRQVKEAWARTGRPPISVRWVESNVYNLYGSIFEWANEGLPLVDNNGYDTNAVHTWNKRWSQWVTNPNVEKVW